tara:strand:- start:49 stop:624 length:576 start_codon:yes stop_codon:yes gene_type:complete
MNKRVKNPDFQKSKIYKITCEETGLLYIGATTMPLSYREKHHLSKYNPCASKQMKCPKMELLFDYPCFNKTELSLKEAEVIKAHKNLLGDRCVNIKMPLRTVKEYMIENKEMVAEKRRIYYNKNCEKIREVQKKNYRENRAHNLKIRRLQNQIKQEIEKEKPRKNWLMKWNKRLLALKNGEDDTNITLNSS